MAPATATPQDPILPPGAGPTLAAITALDGAIAAAAPNFGPLMKDAENSYLKTTYLPLDTLLDAVRGALTAQGIMITSGLSLVPGGFVVITSLAHHGGGWRSSMFPVGDPGNPQKVAAAATYGLRVNLCQILAIVGRDEDGQPHGGQLQGSQPQGSQPQWSQQQPGPPQQQAQPPWPAVPPQQNYQPPSAPQHPAGPTLPGEVYQGAPPAPLASAAIPPSWSPPAQPQPAPQPFV